MGCSETPMISHRTFARIAASALFAVAASTLPACHHGSSGGSVTSGPVAMFVGDTPAPGPATIALLPGTASGASVDVRVTVTGVPQFFGAAFRIDYDQTSLLFNGMANQASFLRSGGVTDANVTFIEDHASNPGVIIVTATRLDPTAVPSIDVTTTSDLAVLNFTARKAIVVASVDGRLDFAPTGRDVQACDTSVSPPTCASTPLTLTWSGGGISAQ
jgi:Cohesin domain